MLTESMARSRLLRIGLGRSDRLIPLLEKLVLFATKCVVLDHHYALCMGGVRYLFVFGSMVYLFTYLKYVCMIMYSLLTSAIFLPLFTELPSSSL